MRRDRRLPVSKSRQARFLRLAWLLLLCLAAAFAVQIERGGPTARWIDRPLRKAFGRVRACVARLLLMQAIDIVGCPPRRRSHGFPDPTFRTPRASVVRMLIGAAFRRALRQRTLGQSFTALFAVLREPGEAVARLVKRLRRGFTRGRRLAVRPAPPRPPRAALFAVVAAPDSS